MRFPGFNDEWQKTTIGDCTERLCNGLTYDTTINQGIKVSRIETIHDKNIDYQRVGFYNGSIDKVDDYIMKSGDILFSHINSLSHIGKTAIYQGEEPLIHGMNLLLLRSKPTINPYFFYYLLNTQKLSSRFQIIAKPAVNQASINTADLKKEIIRICDIPEQDRIANFLKLIDERISTQNKIIEDLKKLKSAIIDRLYSEVKGEICTYSELFTVVTERNSKRSYNKVIAASQEYGMVERESLNLKVQFDESSINTYKIIKSGDYVIHLRSFQGGFAFSRLQGICSPAYIILRPNDRVEYSYYENYFTSSKFINSLRLVTYGIRDGRSINVEEWLSMKVTLPSKDKQKSVIQTIQSIQNKIVNETNILSKLESQRKFCLHAMFI